ncbi:RNA polymerase factor sigma-70 [Paraburkholderia sp. C35]|uniref:RNA polymerase factor sigma-70 n=1 Tax=Paraburkholderia sp. C35 TaxID=2126993 RepID=UPI000D68A622|nr:RNA polymerase factor sigma-70 [Paraburkholderia sp. C35]
MAESMASFAARIDRNAAAFTQGALDDIDCEPAVALQGAHTAAGARTCEGLLLDVLIENRRSLIQLARSFVGCSSRAEDVVHDVFIKLTGFSNQDDVRQPLAYVARMVRNASIDACRRQSLENTWHACEEDGLDVPSPEPTPESALVTRDTLRHAFDALAQLPERTRSAFERVRLREETLQETARALNVSQTLVHFMVRDAAKHCADCVHAGAKNVAYMKTATKTAGRSKKSGASNVKQMTAL